MPSIAKIRFTNVIYENGAKRFNDDIFDFGGENSAILLENGGGKTVFVQAALQAVLPHYNTEERQIRDTLSLEGISSHIAIEWITNEKPRHYVVTAVTLFIQNGKLESLKYVYEYPEDDKESISNIPFVIDSGQGQLRPADRGEISDYYQNMQSKNMLAKLFTTIKDYHEYIESNFKIIPSEWRSIGKINADEGGVEGYFSECKNTTQLINRLLIPVVEDAISEGGTKDFVNSFEKQRERFKKHKQLREIILESKEVGKKIDGYVSVFKDYDEKQQNLSYEKSFAKSVFYFAIEENNKAEIALEENKKDIENIESSLKMNEKKRISLEIAYLKFDLEDFQKKLELINNRFSENNRLLNIKKELKGNLDIAIIKEKIKQTKEQIINIKKTIELSEEELDLEGIKESIEESKSKLKGFFLTEESNYQRKIDRLVIEKISINEDMNEAERELDKTQNNYSELKQELSNKKLEIEIYEKELKDIISEVPGYNINETPENQNSKWSNRISEIQEMIAKRSMELNQIENFIISENQKKDNDEKKLVEFEKLELRYKDKIERTYKLEEELLNKLKLINENWYMYDSIYKRETSIINYLENKIEILEKEKELLFKEERRASRYIDDYENSNKFVAEPLINQIIERYSQKFTTIESGINYLDNITMAFSDVKFEMDGIWASALVVKKDEISRLKSFIDAYSEDLTFPIYIITQEEAKDMLLQNSTPQNIYYPKHWSQNLNKDRFINWKNDLKLLKDKCTELRRQKEKEIYKYNDLLARIKRFIENYPYDELKQLEDNLEKNNANIKSITIEIKEINDRLRELENNKNHYQDEIAKGKEEDSHLNIWVKSIYKYIQRQRNIRNLQSISNSISEDIQKKNRLIEKQTLTLNQFKKNLEDIQQEIQVFTDDIYKLRMNSYYQDTKKSKHVYSDWSLESLIAQYKDLKNNLERRQGNVSLYLDRLNDLKQDEKSLEIDLERKSRDSDFPIDEDMHLDMYAAQTIDKLREEIKELEVSFKTINEEKKEKEIELIKKQTIIESEEKQFYKKFDLIIMFDQALNTVSDELKIEHTYLMDQIQKAKMQNSKLQDMYLELQNIQKEFNIINGKYSFMEDEIKVIYLENDFIIDFPYNRFLYFEQIKERLNNSQNTASESFEFLSQLKNRFINECNEFIKDPKLKERTVLGIRQKKILKDVLDWQFHMTGSIQKIITISEDDMRDQDKDLEQYVSHLHVYIRTISEELGMIPKKTRIKVEDKWKDIFEFQIPSWQEEEGKQEIRKYIDIILNNLDRELFKNVDGTENTGSIHSEIEKMLEIKQLLPIVMKNNHIKIKCRKVTNDKKISNNAVSWEESNKWSGGEKWSKNMTLFLGILNYIAEKRQGTELGKTNRTVIVDNPFGKASSDHVLDPVFFVAEKLGFQIIALTAHAEGSFIRNYFPVVYSCRLREAVDNKTMIMDKTKEIKHAFFKDKLAK